MKNNRTIWHRVFLLMLALMLCFGTFGCADEIPEPQDEQPQTPGTQAGEETEMTLVADGTSEFIIMRSDNAPSMYATMSLHRSQAGVGHRL